DGRSKRATQVLNYYLVALAILFTAYTNAIGKNNSIAAAVAIAGIALTLLSAVAGLYEANAAALAERPLAELQQQVSDKLHIAKFRMAPSETLKWQRLTAIIIAFGLATLLAISGLVYALTR